MKTLKLRGRLAAIAALVPQGARVIDVGTDHGYIPAFLAQSGAAQAVCASDVNPAPLARARETARRYGVSDKIRFFLADGLPAELENEVDTVLLSGMGGDLIARILRNAPWTENCRLILQPQSKSDALGLAFTDAALAREGGRLYIILSRGGGAGFADYFELLLKKRDPLLPDYLGGLILKTQRANRAAQTETMRRELARYQQLLEAYHDNRT